MLGEDVGEGRLPEARGPAKEDDLILWPRVLLLFVRSQTGRASGGGLLVERGLSGWFGRGKEVLFFVWRSFESVLMLEEGVCVCVCVFCGEKAGWSCRLEYGLFATHLSALLLEKSVGEGRLVLLNE